MYKKTKWITISVACKLHPGYTLSLSGLVFVIDSIFLFLNVQIINIYNWVDISAAELPTASIELREARRQRCKSYTIWHADGMAR